LTFCRSGQFHKPFKARNLERALEDSIVGLGREQKLARLRCTVVKIFDRELRMVWYDGAIMMAKTQITLETEMQRRARQRANDLGVSLAEYFRRLLARDLARPETAAHVDRIFDLGTSGGSDIASHKDSMIAEAFRSTRRKPRRR
jgi:hypothetical protein